MEDLHRRPMFSLLTKIRRLNLS